MPSPLGHALGGLAAGWLIAGAPAPPATGRATRATPRTREPEARPWVTTWRGAALLATLAMLPDVDLLFGVHSMYTHSVGAALIVFLAAVALTPTHRVVTGLACAAAYGSHVLLDWMGNDTTPPIGVMALWPFSSVYYESDLHWFMAITRRYWLPNFWTHNLVAVAREVGTLGIVTLAVYWWRRARA